MTTSKVRASARMHRSSGMGGAKRLGYVADTPYEARIHRELCPAWLSYVANLAGSRAPDVGKVFRFLELGCGPGASLIRGAQAFPWAEFHGCDLNGDHLASAAALASEAAVTNLHLHHASFADLAGYDIGAFDFIVAHGVYSWVGAEARADVRRIFASKLRPGGLAYVSYNCLPGWAAEAPLRRLLVDLSAMAGGSTAERALVGLSAVGDLSRVDLRYFQNNDAARSWLEWCERQPAAYLAHEFLNDAWELYYSADVMADLASIGLRFEGSATLVDNYDALLLNTAQAEAIRRLPTAAARQVAADFAVNRRFRRDVFSLNAPRFSRAQAAASLASVAVRATDVRGVREVLKAPVGEVRFQTAFARELGKLLAMGPRTLGELASGLVRVGSDPAAVARNLSFYVALGELTPCAPTSMAPQVQPEVQEDPAFGEAQ